MTAAYKCIALCVRPRKITLILHVTPRAFGILSDAIFITGRHVCFFHEVIGCLYLRKTLRSIHKIDIFRVCDSCWLVSVNLSSPSKNKSPCYCLRLYRNPLTRYYCVSLIRGTLSRSKCSTIINT